MNILLAGGLGYIGSHIAVSLLENGHDVIIADDLSNSKIEVVDSIKKITNKEFKFYNADLKYIEKVEKIFAENKIDGVIHLAGYKAVGESCQQPLMYYENNLITTINLLKCMKKYGVDLILFSSSATVYKASNTMPLTEADELGPCNPYGRTKYFIEEMLKDEVASGSNIRAIILRYFNPIGAHESGLLGDDPNGIPNNLLPYISRVVTGKLEVLSVFGNDYPTPDGTGVRDYIHVVDLADAHLKAIDYMQKNKDIKIDFFNIGTGKGYSVLNIVDAYNKVCGGKVKYKIVARRSGDVAELYANPAKANKVLNWHAKYDIEEMCASSYNYENKKDTK